MSEKSNFLIGVGVGMVAGGFVGMKIMPKKHSMKSTIGKTLSSIGDVIDSVSDAIK